MRTTFSEGKKYNYAMSVSNTQTVLDTLIV